MGGMDMGMGMGQSAGSWWVALLVLLVVATAVTAMISLRRRPDVGRDRDDALELLRRRLATGEIDDTEYLTRRSVLEER